MSESDLDDPVRMYLAFKEAMEQWMSKHRHRFVVPGSEYWPDDIDDKDEALEWYAEQAADEIIEYMEDAVVDIDVNDATL